MKSALLGIIISLYLLINIACATEKVVVIRDDDVFADTPALENFVGMISDNGAKCTLAVIPNKLTPTSILYLQGLNSRTFELATHGFNHDGLEDQIMVMEKSQKKMINTFGKIPTSIAAPNSHIVSGYTKEAKRLGYHSQINKMDFPDNDTIWTIPFNFAWEADWGTAPDWIVTYATFNDFKTTFDNWMNTTSQIFTINVHHAPLYDNDQASQDFYNSLSYMNNRNITFMTEEEAYQEFGT
jgi:hypothetical protein